MNFFSVWYVLFSFSFGWEDIWNMHSRQCFIGYPNTSNFIKIFCCPLYFQLSSWCLDPDETNSPVFDILILQVCFIHILMKTISNSNKQRTFLEIFFSFTIFVRRRSSQSRLHLFPTLRKNVKFSKITHRLKLTGSNLMNNVCKIISKKPVKHFPFVLLNNIISPGQWGS